MKNFLVVLVCFTLTNIHLNANPEINGETYILLSGVYNSDLEWTTSENVFSWGTGQYTSNHSLIIDLYADPPYISVPGFKMEIISITRLSDYSYHIVMWVPASRYGDEERYEVEATLAENGTHQTIFIQGFSPASTSSPYYKISGPGFDEK